ncbi:MAG: putative glycoside hydrolase [Armatimonadota bacterium]
MSLIPWYKIHTTRFIVSACPTCVVFLLGILATSCIATPVRVDLLEGVGDFEQPAPVVEWESYYLHPTFDNPDYDFASNSLYFTETRTDTYSFRSGVDAPEIGDRVATGWRRVTGSEINPGKHIVFDLVSGGINGSTCQYFAMKNLSEVIIRGHIEIESLRNFVAKLGLGVKPGDEVTFVLDYVRMSDYEGISDLGYYMCIQTNKGVTKKRLTPSNTASSAEVSTVIDDDTVFLSAKFVIEGPVPVGRQPGVYIDGAHIYIKRLGSTSYEMREQPSPRLRSVSTVGVLYNPSLLDSLYIASNCDYVVLGMSSDYAWTKHLKALNPNIKLYLYQNSRPTRLGTKDPYFANCGVGYYYAANFHPEWLFLRNPNTPGEYAFCPEYPSEYWAKFSSDSFITEWTNRALARVRTSGCDGVFVDNLSPSNLSVDPAGNLLYPQLDVWEVQKFLRNVCRVFSSARLEVMGNACGFDLNSGSGSAIFDPFWQPTAPYIGGEYLPNTPESTVKHIFQEWSFVRPIGGRMVYDKQFWKICIANMEAVKRWNELIIQKGLSPELCKFLHAYVDLSAATYESAFGPDGWRRFAFCSYLLAHNEWTTFGWSAASLSNLSPLDLSFTATMGEPLENHYAYMGDEYFRYRRYGSRVDNTVLAVVVVNANPDSYNTYVAEFDGVDDVGNQIRRGQQVTLPPCSGRVLLKQTGSVIVRVRASTTNVSPGETVTVNVDYFCNGTHAAHNVVLRAQIPSEMNYLAGSAEKSGGQYDSETNSVYWIIGTVLPGEVGTKTFQGVVK